MNPFASLIGQVVPSAPIRPELPAVAFDGLTTCSQTMLAALRERGPMLSADLARVAGVVPKQVYSLMKPALRAGLVDCRMTRSTSPGRSRVLMWEAR